MPSRQGLSKRTHNARRKRRQAKECPYPLQQPPDDTGQPTPSTSRRSVETEEQSQRRRARDREYRAELRAREGPVTRQMRRLQNQTINQESRSRESEAQRSERLRRQREASTAAEGRVPIKKSVWHKLALR